MLTQENIVFLAKLPCLNEAWLSIHENGPFVLKIMNNYRAVPFA